MARDPLAVDLGQRLRALRTARKLTQQNLATQADVALGAVKHLENGDPATTLSLVRVLRVLGVEAWLQTVGPTEAPFSPVAMAAARDRSAQRAVRARGSTETWRRSAAGDRAVGSGQPHGDRQ